MREITHYFYACTKCNDVGDYYILPNGDTTMCRGEFLAHRDFITTGIASEQEAREWLRMELSEMQGEAPNAPRRGES